MELQEVNRSGNNDYIIKDESVMASALEVLTELSSNKQVTLLAKGDLIPNAVAVANIVTENMLKGNSSIKDIKLDSIISEVDIARIFMRSSAKALNILYVTPGVLTMTAPTIDIFETALFLLQF